MGHLLGKQLVQAPMLAGRNRAPRHHVPRVCRISDNGWVTSKCMPRLPDRRSWPLPLPHAGLLGDQILEYCDEQGVLCPRNTGRRSARDAGLFHELLGRELALARHEPATGLKTMRRA